jgi:hypothetical protein
MSDPTKGARIEKAELSEDGQWCRLIFRDFAERQQVFGFPADQISFVGGLLIQILRDLNRRSTGNPEAKWVLPLHWWEIGQAPELPDELLMTFQPEPGLDYTFRIHRDAARRFREVLSSLLEPNSTPKPEGSPIH